MESSVQPVFLNVEYLFFLVARFFRNIFSLEFLERARVIATVLVIVLIVLVLYLLVRLYELKQEDKRKKLQNTAVLSPVAPTTSGTVASGTAPTAAQPRNTTWEGIRAKLLSDSQSEWRLAIIEADIYMDRLLDERGYHGDTTSDKLKQLTPAELASVQIAWEAHKVRNRIAHDGAAFTLSQPEARRILSYFEIVFRDLGVIA